MFEKDAGAGNRVILEELKKSHFAGRKQEFYCVPTKIVPPVKMRFSKEEIILFLLTTLGVLRL